VSGVYGLTLVDPDGNEVDLVPGGPLPGAASTSDWQVVFGATTRYPTRSPAAATRLVEVVAGLAEQAGVPLSVDLRDDAVTVDSGKDRWDDDLSGGRFPDLAAQIQAAAREMGHTADTAGIQFVQLSIDAVDIAAVSAFWTTVLGYQHDPREDVNDLYDPRWLAPVVIFQQMEASEEARLRPTPPCPAGAGPCPSTRPTPGWRQPSQAGGRVLSTSRGRRTLADRRRQRGRRRHRLTSAACQGSPRDSSLPRSGRLLPGPGAVGPGSRPASRVLDATADLVADRPHGLDALASGVGEGPVLVARAGEDRAGVAAAHGDDDVGGLDGVGGEDPWAGPCVMSTPTSAMAATAAGLTSAAGAEPAERTSTAPPDRAVRNPAAIWERPALWTHTNRTLGLVLMRGSSGAGRWGRRGRSGVPPRGRRRPGPTRTGTSMRGPTTPARAWPEVTPKVPIATAMASSKLLPAAVKLSVAVVA
jgi:hypothetical protein